MSSASSRSGENFVIGPLAGLVQGLTALPVKVLVKSSTATITVKTDAQLLSTDTLGLYATAGADASGAAAGSLFSIGYAQATARAVVDIQSGAVLEAGAAAVVTAGATAVAKMSSSTARELASTPNPGAAQIALSLAVSNADVFAEVTVAEDARIEARKTANVVASGKVESDATAESGIFADGAAGLAFGLEFSNADIHTTVNGTVIAHQDPGSVVKIEIDPLVTNENDIGYVDYARDMIHVGPHALVTEDVITYTNRRGTSIGNLVDGRDYYVIQLVDDDTTPDRDESEWIKLAATEIEAIRAGIDVQWHAGNVIDLKLEAVPTPDTNKRDFSGSDVNASDDSITLRWTGGVFNTFELGQAVVYKQGDTPIEGLVDGSTYYVIASTNQTNLQGNTRFADAQVIGLAETENEARGGVKIDLGAGLDTARRATASRPSMSWTRTTRRASASSPSSTPSRRRAPAPACRARARTRTCGRSSRRSSGRTSPT